MVWQGPCDVTVALMNKTNLLNYLHNDYSDDERITRGWHHGHLLFRCVSTANLLAQAIKEWTFGERVIMVLVIGWHLKCQSERLGRREGSRGWRSAFTSVDNAAWTDSLALNDHDISFRLVRLVRFDQDHLVRVSRDNKVKTGPIWYQWLPRRPTNTI